MKEFVTALISIGENDGQDIKSDAGKSKANLLPEKARNDRRKRLEIRKLMSLGPKPELECLRSRAEKRNLGLEDCSRECEKGPPETSVDKDPKLEGVSVEMEPPEPGGGGGPSEKGKMVENEKNSSSMMHYFKCGSISLIGRRRAMEDAVAVAPGTLAGKFEFFGVYDGHGGPGVANACRERLHKLLQDEMEANSTTGDGSGTVDWDKVMAACFSRMDGEVLENDRRRVEQGEAEATEGSTAVAVVVGKEVVVVANCGDSRAVLCRGGVAMPLSDDDKPDRPDERKRVEAAGGRIIDWEGWRVQGVLATSRSIGDHYLRPYVISDPEVKVTTRTESDEFLIIATDGLWDVVSNKVACDIVRKCLNGRIRRKSSKEHSAAEAASILAELAVAKGSRDNISVIVVDLKFHL